MMKVLNATYLFEKDDGPLPSSESFWSTLFSMYLLHLSATDTTNKIVTTWFCKDEGPPWFERTPDDAWLNVDGLTSNNIAVEPNGLVGLWKNSKINSDPYFTGINPDIVFRIPLKNGGFRYTLIENKVKTDADLNSNQKSSYPDLIKRLRKEEGIECSLFLLQSLGADKMFKSSLMLQNEFLHGNQFGIILWEDVIRCMKRDSFFIKGIDFAEWIPYTEAGKNDCSDWNR